MEIQNLKNKLDKAWQQRDEVLMTYEDKDRMDMLGLDEQDSRDDVVVRMRKEYEELLQENSKLKERNAHL